MWVDLESLSWWLQFVLTVAGVVGVVVVPVWRMLRKSKKGQEDLKEAILTLVKVKLDQLCNDIIIEKKITTEQLENIELLYQSYHGLGGNHGMQNKVDRCRGLELCDKRERKSV